MVIKKKIVLIIDDDLDFCFLARTILEAQGMEVIDFGNLSDARIFLQDTIPNIIILDMELEKEHGTDFLKERATNPIWTKIPVIVCSSQNLAKTVKDAIRFGADDYLLKPIKQTWLIQRIRKNLIKESHLAYYFNEAEEVDLITEAKPISVAETSFVGRSIIGFEKGAIVLATIPQPNDEPPIITHFKCEEKSRFSSSGPFDTLLIIAAVTETEKNRVKMLKSFWSFT